MDLFKYSNKRKPSKYYLAFTSFQHYGTLFCFLFLPGYFSCEKNYHVVKESEAFREALKTPFVENQNLPILKNEFFKDFTPGEIRYYQDMGVNIWKKDELFMRGLTNFISIHEITLNGNDVLVNNFRYYNTNHLQLERSIHFRHP